MPERPGPENQTFFAEAFATQGDRDPVAGSVSLDFRRLQFFSDTLQLEIPLTRLEIQLDDAVAGRIFLSNMDNQDWVLGTIDSRILQLNVLQRQPHTRNQIRALQSAGEFKRRVMITLGVFGAFALIAALLSLMTGIAVRALVAKIPPEWEQEVGDNLMAELKVSETFTQDPKLLTKLDRAVAPLVNSLPKSRLQYKFYVIEEPIANAFALPGGHVVITKQLLDMTEQPEEIAGVVAHELAHVTQKHGFREIISGAGPFLIFRVFLGNSSDALPILGRSSELLVRQSFSQQFELEADDVGWESLCVAKIDPRGLTNMLRKLQAEDQQDKRSRPEIAAFSSHPAIQKRIQRLDAKWNKVKDKVVIEKL